MRADVSDALLRLLDEPRGQEVVITNWVVAAGRYAPRTVVYFLGGGVVRAGDRETAREGNRAQCGCEANDFAGDGDFWHGTAVSRAGICAWLSLVAVDGSPARRRAKHPRAFHDAHGRAVLDDGRRHRCGSENPHTGGGTFFSGDCCNGPATALDDASAEVPAVARRVIHQRRAHLQGAAAVALSLVSLVGVCFCGPGGCVFSVFRFFVEQGKAYVCNDLRRQNQRVLFVCFFFFLTRSDF